MEWRGGEERRGEEWGLQGCTRGEERRGEERRGVEWSGEEERRGEERSGDYRGVLEEITGC